jgi:hypothetical protein
VFKRKLNPRFHQIIFAVLLLATLVYTSACRVAPTLSPTSTVEETSPPKNTVIPTEFPPDFPTPEAEEYADCLARSGRWEVLGFSGPGCNLPTSDGGQACQDSQDCESVCLADPKRAMTDDEFGKEHVGLCSPWKENFGCQVWVEKGRLVEICVD